MKLFTAFFLFALSAMASTSIEYKKALFDSDLRYEEAFRVNPALNRVWIEIKSRVTNERDRGFYNLERIKMDQLSYRADQIIFENEDLYVVCANVNPNGGWRGNTIIITLTGNCSLEKEIVVETIDDGYYQRNVKTLKFNLVLE